MKKYIILILVFCVIFVAAYVSDLRDTSKTQFVLNTISSITVRGNKDEVVNKAFNRVREIEEHMSSHSKTSDLATGILHNDTVFVIKKGIYYGGISQGGFDITIKPICDLWDINGDNPRVPKEEEIAEALKLVDYKRITVESNNLMLPQGMAIELGGIAKGYAADEACRILREAGIDDGFVDLGGNVVAIGEKTVGVRNPLSHNDGDYFGIITVSDCAVATSGGYERYFQQDGVKYHHIFDPATGYPVKTDILSATVICDTAIDADCWSTILFSAGLNKAQEYVEEYNLNAIIVDSNNLVHIYGKVDFTMKHGTDLALFSEKNN